MNYSVLCGGLGKYGMQVPIDRVRARKLCRRYAVSSERFSYGRYIRLSACPKEVSYAKDHGAQAFEYRLVISR